MSTTVQVRDATRRLLDELKKEMNLRNYDAVIRMLVKSRRGIPESLFGSCRGSRPFQRDAEAEHGL